MNVEKITKIEVEIIKYSTRLIEFIRLASDHWMIDIGDGWGKVVHYENLEKEYQEYINKKMKGRAPTKAEKEN